jgi:hypothetical protein
MTRARRWRIVGFAAAPTLFGVFTAGCFIFRHGKAAPQSEAGVPEGEVALNVINHNYLDVVIHVVHDGVQTRVGTATGSSAMTIFLPVRLLGQGREVQLRGYAIGSNDYATTPILVVQPGQYIEWTLETDLRRSSVGVF